MDINWCLRCQRSVTCTTRSVAFCSLACQSSDALSPLSSTTGETVIPSLLRTHRRASSRNQHPPPSTYRRAPRPSFVAAREDRTCAIQEDAVSLTSTSSTSWSTSSMAHHKRRSHDSSPSYFGKHATAVVDAVAVAELAGQLESFLTPPLSDSSDAEGEGFEAYGRGHDRAYYAGSERYFAIPETSDIHNWEDGVRRGPIMIVGDIYDLDVRKRWAEQRELGSWEEAWLEHDRTSKRSREDVHKGKRSPRDAARGKERGGEERKRDPSLNRR